MKKIRLFDKPSEEFSHPAGGGSGIAKKYYFANGYGASVVRFKLGSDPSVKMFAENNRYGSYTSNEKEWELAVIKKTKGEWGLTYDTPITDDVIGHLLEDDVEKILQKIKKLPKE